MPTLKLDPVETQLVQALLREQVEKQKHISSLRAQADAIEREGQGNMDRALATVAQRHGVKLRTGVTPVFTLEDGKGALAWPDAKPEKPGDLESAKALVEEATEELEPAKVGT